MQWPADPPERIPPRRRLGTLPLRREPVSQTQPDARGRVGAGSWEVSRSRQADGHRPGRLARREGVQQRGDERATRAAICSANTLKAPEAAQSGVAKLPQDMRIWPGLVLIAVC
jgi:hypothetical protein